MPDPGHRAEQVVFEGVVEEDAHAEHQDQDADLVDEVAADVLLQALPAGADDGEAAGRIGRKGTARGLPPLCRLATKPGTTAGRRLAARWLTPCRAFAVADCLRSGTSCAVALHETALSVQFGRRVFFWAWGALYFGFHKKTFRVAKVRQGSD
jgi:hypothetical protein